MEKYYLWFRKYWLYFLLVSYVLFIIYSTAVPFNFVLSRRIFSQRFSHIDWIPFYGKHQLIARADVVANIIFFIPLGILLGLQKILSNYRNYTLREWLVILGLGFSISSTVEFLQLFTLDRHTSFTDILTNSCGTLLGAGIILVIYLKFHLQIKAFLQRLFFEKPEMSIAAVLFIFIALSYSLPFTYQLNIASILQNFQQFTSLSIDTNFSFLSLMSSILMYGTLSYFLLSGIYRYFLSELSSWQKFLILLFTFTLPIFLEFYQLLIPIRNHSLSDILAAQGGFLAGGVFFYLQKPWKADFSRLAGGEKSAYFNHYLHYFEGLMVIYLVYCLLYFNSHLLTFYPESFGKVWHTPKSVSDLHSAYLWRLQLLMHLNKEVFTFLPAGFILTFVQTEWKNKGWKISVFLIFMILIVYFIYQLSLADGWFVLSLFTLSSGLYLGQFFWKIFKFMICKYPVEHENRY
jgi:glycopeptide antibiotics resistance protein